jgi:hypothetical protein
VRADQFQTAHPATRNPNSRLTRFRRRLAQIIEPLPANGEGWCIDCTLNGGRTLVISPDGYRQHVSEHVARHGADDQVRIRAAWAPDEPEAADGT